MTSGDFAELMGLADRPMPGDRDVSGHGEYVGLPGPVRLSPGAWELCQVPGSLQLEDSPDSRVVQLLWGARKALRIATAFCGDARLAAYKVRVQTGPGVWEKHLLWVLSMPGGTLVLSPLEYGG